jgi:hypothetical protein
MGVINKKKVVAQEVKYSSALRMDEARTSKLAANIYQSTRRYITGNSILHNDRRESPRSHNIYLVMDRSISSSSQEEPHTFTSMYVRV